MYQKIYNLYFSPTGNAKKIGESMAKNAASQLQLPIIPLDITLPQNRRELPAFTEDDLLIITMPVYAGRLPNKITPDLSRLIQGNQTKTIAAVTYGNRHYDDALSELKALLTAGGCTLIGALAVPSEHAFARSIASGRPTKDDLKAISHYVSQIVEQLKNGEAKPPVTVPGNEPVGPYYTPLGTDGKPAKFLKAKPLTDMELCTNCHLCAESCPMGSISPEEPDEVTGICIKCQACVHNCPANAKHFEDPAFLSHVRMLEGFATEKKEIEYF